MAKHRITDLKA